MKQDEIIEMAKTVGIKYKPVLQEFHSEFCNGVNLEDIEEVVKLVAAKERERIIEANAPELEKANAHIKRLEDQAYDLLGQLKVANIKLSMRPQRTWVGLTDEEKNT